MQENSTPRGYLSIDEIEEIHTVFVILDTDGSGILTPEKIKSAIRQIAKKEEIIKENISGWCGQMDVDQDGKVSWNDFLTFISYWLVQFNVTRPKLRTDLPMSLTEKESFHQSIKGIIANGYASVSFSTVRIESLEARTETWDYLGESRVYTEVEQQCFYGRVGIKIQEAYFVRVLEQLKQNDCKVVEAGLEELKQMLRVLCLFSTSYDRQRISDYLLALFNQIMTQNIMALVIRVLPFDQYADPQLLALEVITLILPGPRLPNFPNESKACVEINKKILIQSGAILKILNLCNSVCFEVRNQALLAIGFITRYDCEIRDLLYNNGALRIVLEIIKNKINLKQPATLVRATWVLSIFSGASMPARRLLPPGIRQQELQEIAETVMVLFQVQDEGNLLANSLISLSFILPNLNLNEFYKWVLGRLIELTTHNDFNVKKTVLQCIRNVICQNEEQSRVLTELGLYTKICEILGGRDNSLKLDACSILRFLTGKGYIWELLNLSKLSGLLQGLIREDNELRWEALRIVKFMLESSTKIAVEDFARTGIIETIFQASLCFRVTNSYISEIYFDHPVIYYFGFLNDSLLVLDKFILSGWIGGDYKTTNTLLSYFQTEQINTLITLIKTLVEECKKGQEFTQIVYSDVNVLIIQVGSSLLGLMEKIILAHKGVNEASSAKIVDLLSRGLVYFKNALASNVNPNMRLDNETLLSCVQKFVIKTMDINNYPYGENHVLQDLETEGYSFLVLRNRICNLYGTEKKIEYSDSKNDKILVNNHESFMYAILDSANSAYVEQMNSLCLLSKPVPANIVIPQVEVKLIVSGYPGPHGYGSYQSNYTDQSSQFLNNKDLMIKELEDLHQIPRAELESMHLDFIKATHNRRPDGKLNRDEFFAMMSSKTLHHSLLPQIFNACDMYRSGFIDFRAYVTAIGVLKGRDLRKKLYLLLNAFSRKNLGFLDKEELFEMIVANDSGKMDLVGLVNNIFALHDCDRDGKLSYDEFVNVAKTNYFNLDVLWTGGERFDEELTKCIQCGKKTQMQGNGVPVKCSECSLFSPSMANLFDPRRRIP